MFSLLDEVKAIKEQKSDYRKCSQYQPTTSSTQPGKSPRPPKSPLTSPRHSTDSPRISVVSPRLSKDTPCNSILAPGIETNLSPQRDEPYIVKAVSKKNLSVTPSDSDIVVHHKTSVDTSDFSSPAFLDISRPKIQPLNDHKVQTLSLKFAALNILTPSSDNNNSIEVVDLSSRDASKNVNDSNDIGNITDDSKIVPNETINSIIDSANVTKSSLGCEEFKDISVSDFSRYCHYFIVELEDLGHYLLVRGCWKNY